MSTLKTLKTRIKSIKSTQKITRAMQLISATRFNKARESLTSSIAYTDAVKDMVRDIDSNSKLSLSILDTNNSRKKHLLIVFASDRGLCGSFNNSIIKLTKKICMDLKSAGDDFAILCIGKRCYESLAGIFGKDMVSMVGAAKETDFQSAAEIAENMIKYVELEKISSIRAIFNKFISVMKSDTTLESWLPIDNIGGGNFEYEPKFEEISSKLISRYLTACLYRALLENSASEHSSRMTAMDSATRNAREMLDELSYVYNRSRQASITKELIEIISGAQAI